jgi:hypothetical protein
MTTPMPETVQLGDLVEAAFDQAAQYATDPAEVSRLATRAVMNMLLRERRAAAVERTQVTSSIGNVRVEERFQS